MLYEETVHVSPVEVMPTLGKGTLGTWRFRRSAGRSDAEPTMSRTREMELGLGQTTDVGAYANRRLNLTKSGRPKEDRPGLRTVPGKSGCTGLSGGLGKRGYGGNVNPPYNRKGKAGNPLPTTLAPELYPDNRKRYTLQQRGCKVQKKRRNGRYAPEFQQYAVERMRVAVNISALDLNSKFNQAASVTIANCLT